MLAQKVLGIPELRDDLADRQIPTESLVPSRAKTAPYCAAGLRRDTQGATVGFGDVNRLNRIACPYIKQPLDGAV